MIPNLPQVLQTIGPILRDAGHTQFNNALRHVITKHIVYANAPFNSKPLAFTSPLFFNFSYGKEIQYTLAVEQMRSVALLFGEVKLIQSVKCELFQ